jgi:hypothetical protein
MPPRGRATGPGKQRGTGPPGAAHASEKGRKLTARPSPPRPRARAPAPRRRAPLASRPAWTWCKDVCWKRAPQKCGPRLGSRPAAQSHVPHRAAATRPTHPRRPRAPGHRVARQRARQAAGRPELTTRRLGGSCDGVLLHPQSWTRCPRRRCSALRDSRWTSTGATSTRAGRRRCSGRPPSSSSSWAQRQSPWEGGGGGAARWPPPLVNAADGVARQRGAEETRDCSRYATGPWGGGGGGGPGHPRAVRAAESSSPISLATDPPPPSPPPPLVAIALSPLPGQPRTA